jgi:RNA polymerase sigma-70 factor (ECF subfamily)
VTQEFILFDNACEKADEAKQIQRAQKEIDQFAVLYDRYVQQIYRFLLARTANVKEAEDLTSQTFLTAMEKLQSYRPTGHFLSWLLCIARNKQIDYYRKHHQQAEIELDENVAEDQQDLVNDLIQKEHRDALKQILSGLPEKDRALLSLRLGARMSFSEMGDYLHKNEDSVKKAYYRLLERIKTRMEGNLE